MHQRRELVTEVVTAGRSVGNGPAGSRTGINRLTDRACKAAGAGAGVRKLADGGGLFLVVRPTGAKLWWLAYRYGGKPKTYSIGEYPDVGLAEARERAAEAREWLRRGLDPTTERRAERVRVRDASGATFAVVAREFLGTQRAKWSAEHYAARLRMFERDLEPALGALPIADLNAEAMLKALRRIEARGAHEVAHKARVLASQICRYAIQTSRLTHNPAANLSDALQRPPQKKRATVEQAQMPALLRALHRVPAEGVTKLAFYWQALTATRPGETRFATWGEIDGDLWRIPAERMKMRDPHVVPLSREARRVLALAGPLRQSRDPGALIFPGFTRHGALSENAFTALLARAGFYGRQTAHGLRASFSTWAHEVAEADPDVVEACLAHRRGDVRAVYNRASYLSRRRELLQAWADQLVAWGLVIE